MLDIVWIIVGALLLYFGGELLVKNASRLARFWGISPLVVGLTIVALGTSSPEMAATLAASFKGAADVALGNVIGSNIVNIGLILGICGIIAPLKTGFRFIRREVPFMILTSALIFPLLWNGMIGRMEGIFLLAAVVFYLVIVVRKAKVSDEVSDYARELEPVKGNSFLALIGILIGLVMLTIGSQSLIEGAVNVAHKLGIPNQIIGLTLVAFSTGLPELASCVVASLKHEPDIILGNIVGSNIFNVLAILGSAAIVHPISMELAVIQRDFWVMMVFSVLIVPFLVTGLQLGRKEGGILTVMYFVYVVYLYL